jgi:hypothetical protein
MTFFCLFLCFPITLLGWTLASLVSSCGFSASWLAGDRGRSVSAPVLGTVLIPGEVESDDAFVCWF